MVIFCSFLAITPVWNLIETWHFRVDDPCDFPDIPISSHKKLPNQTSRNLSEIVIFCSFLAITPVSDLIETCGFCVDDPCDFPDVSISSHKNFTKPKITQPLKNCDFLQFFGHNSSLGLHKDLGFSRG